jgi:hypothetical protein
MSKMKIKKTNKKNSLVNVLCDWSKVIEENVNRDKKA